MAEIAEIDVAHVAKLARLNLSEEETRLFQIQLDRVLEYAAKLREADISDIETTAQTVSVLNVFREDEPRSWLTAEEALSNAPVQANGLFIVTKVLE
jgi:aspartyl-tRNA(Asn)/glutamyl-tRNA(Gln) amidotransferase subunit C